MSLSDPKFPKALEGDAAAMGHSLLMAFPIRGGGFQIFLSLCRSTFQAS